MARKARDKAFYQIKVKRANSAALPLVLTFTDRAAFDAARNALTFDGRMAVTAAVEGGKLFTSGAEAVTEALFWLDLK